MDLYTFSQGLPSEKLYKSIQTVYHLAPYSQAMVDSMFSMTLNNEIYKKLANFYKP